MKVIKENYLDILSIIIGFILGILILLLLTLIINTAYKKKCNTMPFPDAWKIEYCKNYFEKEMKKNK